MDAAVKFILVSRVLFIIGSYNLLLMGNQKKQLNMDIVSSGVEYVIVRTPPALPLNILDVAMNIGI